MIKIIITGFGVVVTLIGLAGMIAPDQFRRALDNWSGQTRFLFAVAIRIAFGAVLLAELVELRHPAVMKFIGGISLVAGFVIIILGQKRLDRLIAWWLKRPDSLLRASMVFATVFGLFLVYVTL